jgi:3'-phosphoadenosine 5'-phosphosulfate (PAPS) 3'-phosphatase
MKVITSRSHPGNVKKVFNNAFKGEKIKHEVAAGAGYKALQVALGNADVYFHTTSIKKWDICAGDALISAIGGIMTTRKGKNIDYKLFTEPHITDGLITAKTATLHKKILNKLKV